MQPTRKNIRLQTYDYRSNGSYFVTLATYRRKAYFSETFKPLRDIIVGELKALPHNYPYCTVLEYIIMPDHIHFIIQMEGSDAIEKRCTLSQIVQAFKSKTTKSFHVLPDNEEVDHSLWQKGYYERVLRSEKELYNVRRYIRENPEKLNWLQEEWKKNGKNKQIDRA